MRRFYARSASDKTDNWPFWFVADEKRGGVNVTGELCETLRIHRAPGANLGARWDMVELAMRANRELPQLSTDAMPYELAFLSDNGLTDHDRRRTTELAARFGW
jgi:hypothetical protein